MILRNMDPPLETAPAGGGGAASPPPSAVADKPEAPPAATAVINATVTEETLRLREEKAALERTVKDRELELARVRDEFGQYRSTVETPKPKAKRYRTFGPFTQEIED